MYAVCIRLGHRVGSPNIHTGEYLLAELGISLLAIYLRIANETEEKAEYAETSAMPKLRSIKPRGRSSLIDGFLAKTGLDLPVP
jgi:hypothetical protein